MSDLHFPSILLLWLATKHVQKVAVLACETPHVDHHHFRFAICSLDMLELQCSVYKIQDFQFLHKVHMWCQVLRIEAVHVTGCVHSQRLMTHVCQCIAQVLGQAGLYLLIFSSHELESVNIMIIIIIAKIHHILRSWRRKEQHASRRLWTYGCSVNSMTYIHGCSRSLSRGNDVCIRLLGIESTAAKTKFMHIALPYDFQLEADQH